MTRYMEKEFDRLEARVTELEIQMTPEFKILLQKALDSLERHKNEDIDEWAKRLTDDVCPPTENEDE